MAAKEKLSLSMFWTRILIDCPKCNLSEHEEKGLGVRRITKRYQSHVQNHKHSQTTLILVSHSFLKMDTDACDDPWPPACPSERPGKRVSRQLIYLHNPNSIWSPSKSPFCCKQDASDAPTADKVYRFCVLKFWTPCPEVLKKSSHHNDSKWFKISRNHLLCLSLAAKPC